MMRIALYSAAAALLVVGFSAPSPTTADVPLFTIKAKDVIPKFGEIENMNEKVTLSNQDVLDEIGENIRNRYEGHALTGLGINPITYGIWIWFYPSIPSEVYEIQSQYPQVIFNFEISKYSRAKLAEQREMILRAADLSGINIAAISLPPDGGGLTIYPHTSSSKAEVKSFLENLNPLIDSQDLIVGEPINPASAIAFLNIEK